MAVSQKYTLYFFNGDHLLSPNFLGQRLVDAPKRSNTRSKGMDEYGGFTAPMSILIQVLVSKKKSFSPPAKWWVSRFQQLQLLHLLFLFFRGFFLLSPSCRLDGTGAHSKCRKLIEILDATGAPEGPEPYRELYQGVSENRVYSHWNSHLIGIMIINHWV